MGRKIQNKRHSFLKGQGGAIEALLISGILIGVVGSVYFWGVPLIEKNKDIAILDNSEALIKNLNNRIKFIANNGGRDQLRITVPGIVRYDSATRTIELVVDTGGTIYATDAEIPFGRNTVCTDDSGVFGLNDPETICIKSSKVVEKKFRTAYTLRYIKLVSPTVTRDFEIRLAGQSRSGGEDNTIIFENKGTTESVSGGRTLISTVIEINIV